MKNTLIIKITQLIFLIICCSYTSNAKVAGAVSKDCNTNGIENRTVDSKTLALPTANNFVFIDSISFDYNNDYALEIPQSTTLPTIFEETEPSTTNYSNFSDDEPCIAIAGPTVTLTCANPSGIIGTPAIAGLSYSWSPAAGLSSTTVAQPTVTATVTTNYSVTVTTSTGSTCTSVVVVEVTNTNPTLNVTTTPILCNGNQTTITATATLPGTNNSYQYAIGALPVFSSTNTFTQSAGTYTIWVRDIFGCSNSSIVTITQPLPITFIDYNNNVPCAGGTVSLNVIPVGGTGTILVSVNGLPQVQLYGAATYTIVGIDANGCSASVIHTKTQPTPNILQITNTPILCNSTSNPNNPNSISTITASNTGGTPPYLYSIDPTGLYNTFSSNNVFYKNAGTYTIWVIDANFCKVSTVVTITEPLEISYTAYTQLPLCFGTTVGSYTIIPSGGVAPYTVLIDGAPVVNPYPIGNHVMLITDFNGCQVTTNLPITPPPPQVFVTATATPILCNGNTSTITATATGGIVFAGYKYGLGPNPVYTTASTITVTAGTYSVWAKDNFGCEASTIITITQPPVLDFTSTGQTPFCSPNLLGTFTVTPLGGTPGYVTLINGAPIVNPYPVGSYSLSISDVNGCTKTATLILPAPGPQATVTATVTNIICSNSATITVSATGGFANGTPADFQYGIGANPVFSNNPTFTESSGTYTVWAKDIYGCSVSTTVVVNSPGNVTLTSFLYIPNCFNQPYGFITITPSFGTPPYVVLIDNLPPTNPYSIGTHFVKVTDSNGCIITKNIVVTPPPPPIVLTASATPILCSGQNNSTITLSSSGGYIDSVADSPEYALGINPVFDTVNTFSVTAGTYTVWVKDFFGCSTSLVVTITAPTPIVINATTTPILCYGNSSTLSLNANGGTAPYQYGIGAIPSFSSTNSFIRNVGTYTIWVRDANLCSASSVITVTQPTALTISATAGNIVCNGGTTNVTLNTAGGTGVITTSPSNTNLVAGNYTFTATDANGCTKTTSVTITQPSAITISATAGNILCNGGTTNVTLNTAGGNGVITTFPASSNLVAGVYTFVATDANNCNISKIVVITQPTQVLLTTSTSAIICNGGTSTFSSTGFGGTPNYEFAIGTTPTFSTNNQFVNNAGTYTLWVRDANLCSYSGTLTITEPSPVSINVLNANLLCNGSIAPITLSASGGTPTYLYAVGNSPIFSTTNTYTLPAGVYTIWAKDANNCTASSLITKTQAPAVTISATSTPVLCFGNTSTITLTGAGGTGTLTYAFGGIPVFTANNTYTATAGTYSLWAKDVNGCVGSTAITVTQPPQLNVIAGYNAIACYGNTSYIQAFAAGGVPAYSFSLNGGAYSTNYVFNSLLANDYTIAVKDMNNCTLEKVISITQPPQLIPSVAITAVLCVGQQSTISVSAVGGTTPYLYATDTNIIFSNSTVYTKPVGTYTVWVKDALGCSVSTVVNVTPAPILTVTSSVSSITCNNGLATAVVSGSNPATGVWSSNVANPLGSTVGLTASGSSIISFANAAFGTFKYYYNTPNGCIDSVSIAVTPKPNAGADQTICASGIVLLSGSNTANGIWTIANGSPVGATISGTNSGFANANFTNTTTANFNFVYTVNGCADTTAITVNPIVNAGIDGALSICENTAAFNLATVITGEQPGGTWYRKTGIGGTLTSATGNFLPSIGTSNSSFYYVVTGIVPCINDSSVATITVKPTTASTQTVSACFYNIPYTWNGTLYSASGLYTKTFVNTSGCDSFARLQLIIDTTCTLATIGNYVWRDDNGNGLQDDGFTNGLNGVTVNCFSAGADGLSGTADDIFINSVVTNNDSVGNPGYYLFTGLYSGNYFIQFPKIVNGDSITTTNQAPAVNGNSDANKTTGNSGIIAINVNGSGVAKNNVTIDAGYKPIGSLGNYVWRDDNGNGLQDEPTTNGINNVKVKLYHAGIDGIVGTADDILKDSTTTANNILSEPGYYQFENLLSGTCYVKFPTTVNTYSLTTQTTAAQIDGNSDANVVTGNSPAAAIIAYIGGLDKDNPTLDAGYKPLGSIGNYAWRDDNGNGLQDEPIANGINGLTVQLFKVGPDGTIGTTDDVLNATTTTSNDGLGNPGYYLFPNLLTDKYYVKFPITYNGAIITTTNPTTQTDGNNDANVVTGNSGIIILQAFSTAQNKNNITIDVGYKPMGSIGNYVWRDDNGNGLQDEPTSNGLNGISINLYLTGADGLLGTIDDSLLTNTITTNDAAGNPGYYLFSNLLSNQYYVQFPINTNTDGLTLQTTTAQVNGNSDANQTTGKSENIILQAYGVGANKDNLTIDAGYAPVGSIGNFVWNDDNANGLQDEPAANGINGITVVLYNVGPDALEGTADDVIINTTTTSNNTSGNPGYYLFTNLLSGNYFVKFPTATNARALTISNNVPQTDGNSDANTTTGNSAVFAIQSFGVGLNKNNITIDAGYKPGGSISNYVWKDKNANGLQDETITDGINGVTIQLFTTGIDGFVGTADDALASITTTVNDANGNPGFYNFPGLATGSYYVKFPIVVGNASLTTPNQSPVTDGNSDANIITGNSIAININALGTGVSKDNNTIDAGYLQLTSLGNYVWLDANKNGVQDATEVGISGITVSLINASNTIIASTITDAYGKYLFSNLIPGSYAVRFSNCADYQFTQSINAGDNQIATNSDANTSGSNYGATPFYTLVAGEYDSTVDAGLVLINTTTQTIGNYVWLDANANGIQDSTEDGTAGVTVTLLDSNGNAMATTFTNMFGNYLFKDVTVGTYAVRFSLPIGAVFTTNNGGLSVVNNSDVDINTGTSSFFTITAGEANVNVDAGIMMQSVSNASVGNKVWLDDNQNGLLDTLEAGLPNVKVHLLAPNNSVLASTITNAFGYYVFNNIIPGVYKIAFDSVAGYMATTSIGLISEEKNSDAIGGKTDAFTLVAGDKKMNISAGFFPISAIGALKMGNLVWYDDNKNGLQDTLEAGVSGVAVTLYNASGVSVATTATDEHGQYLFVNLVGGNYTILFNNIPSGFTFTTQEVSYTNTGSNANANGWTSAINLNTNNFTIDAGIIPTVVGASNASLGDKVWYDVNANGIQDPIETGLVGIQVKLLTASNAIIATTTTDGLGNYLFTNLQAGNYIVQFIMPLGYAASPNVTSNTALNSDGVAINANTYATPIINLAASQNKMDVDQGFYNVTANAAIGNIVWNDVNNNGIQESGEPGMPGISVTLFNASGAVMATTTTNANGNYLFSNVTAGAYFINFSNLPTGFVFTAGNQGADSTKDGNANALGSTSQIVIATNQLNTTIDAGIYNANVASLGGNVWDDANADGYQQSTEQPTSGLLVTLKNIAGIEVSNAITDGNGNYLFPNLNPGFYTVSYTKPTATQWSVNTTPTSGNIGLPNDNNTSNVGTTASINLSAGRNIRFVDAGYNSPAFASVGNFVWNDANGNGSQDAVEFGIPGVLVTLLDVANNPMANTITNANGFYIFDNVIPQAGLSITFSNIPANTSFTTYNASSSTPSLNSDAQPAGSGVGQTAQFALQPNQHIADIDAGIVEASYLGSYVWFDADADGEWDANELPTPGVKIYIIEAGSNIIVDSTITNSIGLWKTPVAGNNTYYIKVDSTTFPINYHITNRNNPTTVSDDVDNDGIRSNSTTPPVFVKINSYVSNVWVGISTLSAPLPVSIVLEGQILPITNQLVWHVDDQTEVMRYELKKIVNGNYQIINTQLPTTNINYTFYDADIHTEDRYIVAAIGNNNTELYSNMVTLNRNQPGYKPVIVPNPTIGQANITFYSTQEGEAIVRVFDAAGKLVRMIQTQTTIGNNNIEVDISTVANGVYSVTLFTEDGNATMRVKKE